MNKAILISCFLLFNFQVKAQPFKKLSLGLDIKQFYHQQGINYYLNCQDLDGRIYAIHYDTVSSSFNLGHEFSQIRLQIYNGISWLYSKPIKLYSLHSIDPPRILDIKFSQNKVYIAGSFDSSENNLGAGLLCLNGQDWESSGLTLMQTQANYFEVKEIHVFNQDMFITGNFDSIPGLRVNGLLWYNNSVWKPVGMAAPYGFRNLSNTGNVFFNVVHDSLFVFNKNKIKPDSIEIGGQILKKLAIFNQGQFIPVATDAPFIGGLSSFQGNLVCLPSSAHVYISSIQIKIGSNWQTFALPDSFYATGYVGSYEKNGNWYGLFQNGGPPEIRIFEFNGTAIQAYKTFKLSSQYLALNFSRGTWPVLSASFSEVVAGNYQEKHNQIIGLLFEPAALVQGITFLDKNGDGIKQSGENPAPFTKVYDVNGLWLTESDKDGKYLLQLPLQAGVQIEAENEFKQHSNNSFIQPSTEDSLYIHDFALQKTGVDDLGVYLSSSTANKAKQGFVSAYFIDLYNYSDQNQSAVIRVNLNPRIRDLEHKNYSPISFDKFGFNIPVNINENSRERFHFTCVYHLDSFALGAQVQLSVQLNQPDDQMANNTDSLNQTVVAAFDPNIKVAFPEQIVNNQKEIKYTIWFQNEGNDTALNVTVVDSFGSLFDISKVIVGGSSHGNVRPEVMNNSLIWHFRNIYLPSKKQDSVNSIGFVSFRTKLNASAQIGDTVYNKASIYFDYQKPVITNKARVVLYDPVSVPSVYASSYFVIYPNPSSGIIYYEVKNGLAEHMEIFTLEGRLIATIPLDVGGSGEIEIPQDIAGGIYLLRLKGSNAPIQKLLLWR